MQHQGKEPAASFSGLILGLDLGSVSLNSVVLDPGGKVLWSDYTRTKGKPLPTALEVLDRIFSRYPREDFSACALTGTGAASLAPLVDGLVVNEIIALTRGVSDYHPEASSIIDMGGEDAKLVLTQAEPDGGLAIRDFAMNTMCAAGTGSFLDQQSHRLQLTIEEFSELALKSQNPPRLAGRCSVFAKTDMIHLQQDATPDYDIVAGLCFAMARNLKSNIAKGKKVTPPVIFTGGGGGQPRGAPRPGGGAGSQTGSINYPGALRLSGGPGRGPDRPRAGL